MKYLGWVALTSSLLSIGSGVVFMSIGIQKEEAARKKQSITVTRAHPKLLATKRSANDIELRSGPAEYFPVIGSMGPKEDFQVIDYDGEWYRIAPVRNPAAAAWTKLSPSLR